MLFPRILASALKPALAGGALMAAAAGGWFTLDRLQGDSLTPFEAVQRQGERLVVSEFGESSDLIVAVDPDDAAHRTEIARISHAPGYGVFATLSPAGDAIAYTALPEDEPKPDAGAAAIAGIVRADGSTDMLADDVDLLIAPVWSPDGASIVVRKNQPLDASAGAFTLLRLGVDGSREEIASRTGTALFPVGFSPDGATFYYSTLDATGSDLWSVGSDSPSEARVAHLFDGIARDWTLSPDGSTVAYSVALGGDDPRIATMTVDVRSGAVAESGRGDGARAEFNPAWDASGSLTIASVDADGSGGETASIDGATRSSISARADGVDLPLSWSPDGETLAVRSVQGPGADAGESHVELLAADGGRQRISDKADVLIVGWLP